MYCDDICARYVIQCVQDYHLYMFKIDPLDGIKISFFVFWDITVFASVPTQFLSGLVRIVFCVGKRRLQTRLTMWALTFTLQDAAPHGPAP